MFLRPSFRSLGYPSARTLDLVAEYVILSYLHLLKLDEILLAVTRAAVLLLFLDESLVLPQPGDLVLDALDGVRLFGRGGALTVAHE